MSNSFVFAPGFPFVDPSLAGTRALWLADESKCVDQLLPHARLDPVVSHRVQQQARRLVVRARTRRSSGNLDAFLEEYDLSTPEGVVLMCLAEALLRIPDAGTADALIRDKLAGTQWEADARDEGGLLLNAATWGLMLTGTLTAWAGDARDDPGTIVRRLVGRAGEPFVRGAIRQAMKIMAEQFIVGETIADAIAR